MIDIPPQLETVIIKKAEIYGISPAEFVLQAVKSYDDDIPLYDIERMNECLKGVETEELALKNGIEVPSFDTFEELQHWMRVEMPKIANNRSLAQENYA